MKQVDIVLLHGWNLSKETFVPLHEAFTKAGFRVHSLDFPGFGNEKAPVKPWHIVDYAEFLKRYIDMHHIKEAVLVGHSFGGRVALKFVQLYPSIVSHIVLSGTPGFSPVLKRKMLFFFILAKIGTVIFSIPPLSIFEDWAKRFLYYASGSREFFKAEGSMRQTFKNVVADDLLGSMQSVMVPCLLLWGEFDVMVPLSIMHRMAEVLPTATVKVIPEADHGVPFKEPQVFVSYVQKFLKDTI
ncbi:MAG: alpha/beta hydrolase [Patescibacteria group bacterium]